MRFRTEIEPLDEQGTINHDTRVVTIGSCFSDTIGKRLYDHAFDVSINPMGILFNPASIAEETDRAVSGIGFTHADAIQSPDKKRWVSFHRHSSTQAATCSELVERLNGGLMAAREAITNADIVILTLGSARCFIHTETGMTVANCHRFHPDTFRIEDLESRRISDLLSSTMLKLRDVNPGVKFILTVSPVRHVSYGLAADRLSKSRLIVSAHELSRTIPGTIYFPAYEILTDDLRDYRFYDSDLVHPTAFAADYVFEIFVKSFVDIPLQGRLQSWKKICRQAEDGTIDATELLEKARSLNPSDKTFSRFAARLKAC